MSLLANLTGNGNNSMITQLAEHFGVEGGQMQSLLQQLAPALSGGFMNNAQQNTAGSSPLSSLFNLFQADKPGPTLDANPSVAQLRDPATVETGNSILGQIFGNKDVSRQVAATAAENTGIGANIVKQALPMIAVWAASELYKKFQHTNDNVPASAGAPGLLSQFLGGDQQHSMAQQVMGLLRR